MYCNTGGRGETVDCAIVCAMKEGSGVPKQRWCLQRIVLSRAHTPRNKTISCPVSQTSSDAAGVTRPPLFRVSAILAAPEVLVSPPLTEVI